MAMSRDQLPDSHEYCEKRVFKVFFILIRMNRKKVKKILITTLKGVGLVTAFWIINTFIAFVPFSVKSNPEAVIMTWLVVDFAFIFSLVRLKQVDRWTAIPALIFIGLLAILYLWVPLNSNIPANAIKINSEISQKNANKYDYAKELFFAVEKKYSTPVREYLLEPWKVFFIRDFAYFWNLREGAYADSNIQGRIYRALLLESGRFSEDEVVIHQSFCSNSPHLLIKLTHPEKGEMWADFWAVDNFPGAESNKTYEFGMRTITPCNDLIGQGY